MIPSRAAARRLAWLPGGATLLAIACCYGTALLVGAFSLLGITLSIHDGTWAGGVWAGSVTFFALLAFAGVLLGYRYHGSPGPVVLALAGSGLIAWVMLTDYNRIAEAFGFAALAAAATWHWWLRRPLRQQENLNAR